MSPGAPLVSRVAEALDRVDGVAQAMLEHLPQALVAAATFSATCGAVAFGLHLAATRTERRRRERLARWEPLLLDVLAGDAPPERIAETVRPDEVDDLLAMLVRYALRLDGASRDRLRDVARPFLDRGRELLRARRSERRALGAHLLGVLGDADDRPRLVEALGDPSPGVAMGAARALSRSGDLDVLPALVAALDRFVAWDTPAVTSMLARFGLAAGPPLALRLADPDAPEPTRVACAEALRRLGYVPADALVGALLAPDAPTPREVRLALLRLVAEIGTPAHAPLVRRHLAHPDTVVRLHAVSALGALGDPARDAAALEEALGDADTWTALRAAHALARLGRRDVLARAARHDDDRGRLARQTLAPAC